MSRPALDNAARIGQVKQLFVTRVDDLAVGGTLLYRTPDGRTVNITRREASGGAGDFIALSSTCPHLGCQVPQLCGESQWFECLCHGSKYTVIGEHRDGPAPRGMDRFEVTVQGDDYVVVTSTIVSGPPTGTVTFDDRTTGNIPHCAG